jgi:hypothetical protein
MRYICLDIKLLARLSQLNGRFFGDGERTGSILLLRRRDRDLTRSRRATLGLKVALDLVSDECALSSNDCTSRTIVAGAANKLLARGRR